MLKTVDLVAAVAAALALVSMESRKFSLYYSCIVTFENPSQSFYVLLAESPRRCPIHMIHRCPGGASSCIAARFCAVLELEISSTRADRRQSKVPRGSIGDESPITHLTKDEARTEFPNGQLNHYLNCLTRRSAVHSSSTPCFRICMQQSYESLSQGNAVLC